MIIEIYETYEYDDFKFSDDLLDMMVAPIVVHNQGVFAYVR